MKIAVIGGGPAGLMAAYWAGINGDLVTIYERNEKIGKKLYITGKGRCNVTNNAPMEDFMSHYINNSRFLYSAVTKFDNTRLTYFLEDHGTKTKVERGGRVFPVSDKASDVTKAFYTALKVVDPDYEYNKRVKRILTEENGDTVKVKGIELYNGHKAAYDKVIVATGGMSYPATGSTGDGYKFAEELGINVIPPSPGLVPVVLSDKEIPGLEGLSLKNVELNFTYGRKKSFKMKGEMIFTHDGISGPIALFASSVIGRSLNDGPVSGFIDLKIALSPDELDRRIIREVKNAPKRHLKSLMRTLLPERLVDPFLDKAGLDPEKGNSDLTILDRRKIISFLKHYPITATGIRSFKEAIITQGGIDTKEINPHTMESRKVKGLYFAGEVIDYDGTTGGYNIQAAVSTGYLAGCSASGAEA